MFSNIVYQKNDLLISKKLKSRMHKLQVYKMTYGSKRLGTNYQVSKYICILCIINVIYAQCHYYKQLLNYLLIVKHNSFHILPLVYWNMCFTYMYLHWYYSTKASNQIFLMQKYIISADNYPNIFIHVQRKTTSLCTCLISIQLALLFLYT